MQLTDYWNKAVNPGRWLENTITDTEYSLGVHNGKLYIVFQGSSEFIVNQEIAIDWWQNFDFRWSYCYIDNKVVKVHEGFLSKWLSVQIPIMKYVLESGIKDVVVLGFSQGAGDSFPCACFLKDYGFNVEYVGFGVPRFIKGEYTFSNNYFNKFTIVRVENDLVTKAPFNFQGYKHYGKEEILTPLFKDYRLYANHMSYGKILGGIDLIPKIAV